MKRHIVLFLGGLCFFSLFSRAETLPKPTGKYFLGVTYLSFVDEGRKELFDGRPEARREITVKVWYPAEGPSPPEPYLLEAEAAFALKYLQFPPVYGDLKTNAGRDVPVSAVENKYPVLVFSHGWGEHYSQNTILMEELASRGYIVFSIAHHYECKFSSYSDGRLIRIDMGNPRLQVMMKEQMNPKAMGLFDKLKNAADDEERWDVFRETNDTLPTVLKESPVYWAADTAFLMDRLVALNAENGLFRNKLDLDRIGALGMSMGGIAASELCATDERVTAGISIDGGLYGPSNVDREARYRVPFLFLNSRRFLGCGALFAGKSTRDCYSLTVGNADHYDFSDYALYPVPSVRPLQGPIEGKRAIEIMNVVIPAFLDKYLKGRLEIDLIETAKSFAEIEFATNAD